jgi:predicted RNA binding protein YcfA (HicA-like mRNA interferase family)
LNHGSPAGAQAARSPSCPHVARFVEVRQRGAHRQFRHPDGRATTVPDHGGRDLSPILLRQIIKDIKMTAEEFIRCL